MTGTVESLPAGAFGVDFSFGRPALDDMLTLGVQFVSRYVCIDNALTHDKLWTLDQLRFYADAGILAMVNYEQGENTTLGGETAGRKHGKVAADWRHYLGMPADMPMPISTDQGVTASQFSAIADFHAAFVDEGGGPVGCYHGTTLCAYLENRGLNDLTWMAMATSWSPGGETDSVHVRQKGYVLGSCDANYVRKPTPFWNFNGEPLKPTEVDMEYVIYQCSDADAAFLGLANAQGIAVWIEWLSGGRKAQLRADGLSEKPTAVAGCANCTLFGEVPPEDSRHNWTTADFGHQIGASLPGPPGKDAPIPRSFTPVY